MSRTLTYDALDRYTGVTITNPNAPNGFTRGTYYNGGGNITSRTLVGGYTYAENSAPPHAVTTITQQGNITHYGYDANGRLTSGAGYASITWNPYNEPTELEAGAGGNPPSVWLGYDPDGNLLTKTVYGNAQWRYFGKLFVQTGSSYRERIAANGEVVAVMNVNSAGFPSVNYLIHDNLGSTAAVLDASGALEGRYAWDVWGDLVNPATGNGPDPNQSADEALTSLGYTGHEMFWAAGFVHTQMRLYAPAIGRWLSPDPTVPNLYDGQSLNRYSYVLNNPMTFTDPLGLCTEAGQGPSCTSGILLKNINVVGHCGVECAGQQLANQSLSLWITSAPIGINSYSGPSAGSYSGQRSSTNTKNNAQKNKQSKCSIAAAHEAEGDAIAATVGFLLGDYGGKFVGGAIGSLGNLAGPEVGIGTTMAGVYLGGRYGGEGGAIAGEAIWDSVAHFFVSAPAGCTGS